ncbi:MAG TPA: MlaD family protein [Caulobacteraceae bacterium]|nr:MlaD family protein [Caulobacteraceae bacterium]
MIKRLIIAAALVAAVVVVVLLVSGGGSSDGYRVRAIFDNGAFMVTGEQVRIAGANAGKVEEVAVTMPDDVVAYRNGQPVHKPGKAVIVMRINTPGFEDFRQDANCLIRPQSLIGEKFVDCRPTQPRAPGSPPPPPLRKIPDGQPGAGEYLLPLGNSGTSVDPDLINDIQTLPYAQRFRLIFNELGAGFAGRGEDLEVLVKRANPVLRDVDRLFGILTAQRNELAQLSSDSEAILGPLSRERAAVAGFLSNSGAAAEASSERGPQLEEALRKFPTFLTEFRKTMRSLGGFSVAATPVLEDLGAAAPALTDATRTLTPFSEALTVSLKSLGKAGEGSGPLFAEADPVVRKAGTLAKSGVKPTKELAALFSSLEEKGGWDGLVELIYNGAATFNGFDQYGHFGRTLVVLSNCTDYVGETSGSSGCSSRFNGLNASEAATTSAAALYRLLLEEQDSEVSGGRDLPSPGALAPGKAAARPHSVGTKPGAPKAGVAESSKTGGTEPLLDYLLGP